MGGPPSSLSLAGVTYQAECHRQVHNQLFDIYSRHSCCGIALSCVRGTSTPREDEVSAIIATATHSWPITELQSVAISDPSLFTRFRKVQETRHLLVLSVLDEVDITTPARERDAAFAAVDDINGVVDAVTLSISSSVTTARSQLDGFVATLQKSVLLQVVDK